MQPPACDPMRSAPPFQHGDRARSVHDRHAQPAGARRSLQLLRSGPQLRSPVVSRHGACAAVRGVSCEATRRCKSASGAAGHNREAAPVQSSCEAALRSNWSRVGCAASPFIGGGTGTSARGHSSDVAHRGAHGGPGSITHASRVEPARASMPSDGVAGGRAVAAPSLHSQAPLHGGAEAALQLLRLSMQVCPFTRPSPCAATCCTPLELASIDWSQKLRAGAMMVCAGR